METLRRNARTGGFAAAGIGEELGDVCCDRSDSVEKWNDENWI